MKETRYWAVFERWCEAYLNSQRTPSGRSSGAPLATHTWGIHEDAPIQGTGMPILHTYIPLSHVTREDSVG